MDNGAHGPTGHGGPERRMGEAIDTERAAFWLSVDQLASQQQSDSRLPLLVSLLFPVRRDTTMDRTEFEIQLRRGMAIRALIGQTSLEVLKGLYHPESAERVTAALPQGKPEVFLDNHFTSVVALRFFNKYLFKNSQHLNSRGVERRGATTSLVRLIRAVQSGQHVIVAPDGALGDSIAQINVLGFPVRVGKGAAVLAHAAKCPVVIMHAIVEDGYFVPQVVVGPSPCHGEALENFVARVLSFYEDHMNLIVKGDPINMGAPERILTAFRRSIPTMGSPLVKYSIDACNEALTHGDDAYATRQVLSDLYRRAGNPECAIRYSQLAMSAATNEQEKISSIVRLASLLRIVKRLSEALDLVESSILGSPNSAMLHLTKSQILLAMKQSQQAIEFAETALGLDPTSPLICRHLAVLHTRAGNLEKASSYEKRASLIVQGN